LANAHTVSLHDALPIYARRRDPHDRAGETGVGNHQVAATADQQDRLPGGIGLPHDGDELVGSTWSDQPLGRTAEAQRGELGDRDVGVDGEAAQGRHQSWTIARARDSTGRPAAAASRSTRTRSSASSSATVPAAVSRTPWSSSGTRTGSANRVDSSTTRPGSPTQSVTTRAARPIVSMPCAITPGSPTARAARSLQWIGLKSPDAPA